MQTSRIRSIVGGTAVVVAVAAAAELVARVTVAAPHAAREAIADAQRRLRPCTALQEVAGEPRRVAGTSKQVRHFVVTPRPASSRARVVVVGESGAAMLGDRLLELVAARGLNAAVEVLNCAQEGASLEQVQYRYDEALTLEPQVVVLLVGHNLAIRPPPPAWRLQARDLLLRSRFLVAVAGFFEAPLSIPVIDLSPGRVAELERWLAAASAAARRHETRLVVVAVGANLEIPPPVPEDEYFDPALLEARWRWAVGDFDGALEVLDARLRSGPGAYLHFVRARWLARRGQHDGAHAEYLAARDGPQSPRDRVRGDVLAALVSGAAEHGAFVIPVAAASTEHAGWQRWRDHCHLTRQANFDVAERVLGLLRIDEPGVGSYPAGPREALATRLARVAGYASVGGRAGELRWREAATTAVEYAFENEPDAESDLKAFLTGPVLAATHPVAVRASVLDGIADGLRAAGRRDLADPVVERAQGLGQASTLVQATLWSVADGRSGDARGFVAAALAVESTRRDALFYARKLAASQTATPR